MDVPFEKNRLHLIGLSYHPPAICQPKPRSLTLSLSLFFSAGSRRSFRLGRKSSRAREAARSRRWSTGVHRSICSPTYIEVIPYHRDPKDKHRLVVLVGAYVTKHWFLFYVGVCGELPLLWMSLLATTEVQVLVWQLLRPCTQFCTMWSAVFCFILSNCLFFFGNIKKKSKHHDPTH